jgi:hypothetical protein
MTEKTIVKSFLAAIFWSIWKTCNRACFDNILPLIQVEFCSSFVIGLIIEVNYRNKRCKKCYVDALIF